MPDKVKNDNSIDGLDINNEHTGKSNFPVWGSLAFFSGFCVLSYEILWGRMAKFLLGDRTIAITTLLFVFILSLGLGSLVSGRLSRYYGFKTTKQAVKLISWIFLISSLPHLAIIPLTLKTISGQGLYQILPFDNIFIRRVIIIWILILPPITFLGIAFPYLLQSAKDLDKIPGKIAGKLYLINTFGAVLGAIFINWVCIRWIGTIGGFIFIIGVMVVFSFITILFVYAPNRRRIAVIMALVIFTVSALNYQYKMVFLNKGETLITENEDEYGIQSLVSTERNYLRVRNNRIQLIYDLGHWQTSHAQQMAAHLPILFAGDYEHVLNIGTGYGITAGAFTLYPEIKSIETIEILPFLVQNQNKFKDYNYSYFNDPRVSLIQGDGRNYLFKSKKEYDIISVNVLDPYLPGSSSLYTVDFWELAKRCLRPGGVFTQLFWGNDVPLLVKGLLKVFPTVLCFPAYGDTAYNIVAFTSPVNKSGLNIHLERLVPEVLTNISKFTNVKPQQYLRQLTKGSWVISKILEVSASKIKGRRHTDNFPVLEYRWTHGVKGISIFDTPMVKQ